MTLQSFSCTPETSPSSSLPFTLEPGPSSTAISTSTSEIRSSPAVSSFEWVTNGTSLEFHQDLHGECDSINNSGEVLGMKSGNMTSLEGGLFSEFTILREEVRPREDFAEEDEEQPSEQYSEPSLNDLEEELLSPSAEQSSLSNASQHEHRDEVESTADSSLAPPPHFGCSSTIPPSPPPSELSLPSQPVFIRHFYPIDQVTFMQRQDPVYNHPQYPIVQPIPVWPSPEFVEWQKTKRKAPCYDTMEGGHLLRKKRKTDESSEDEEYGPNYSSSKRGRAVKRVRWKSVDDIAPAPVFKSMTPLTVDLRQRPFVSVPLKDAVEKSLYRALSIPHFSPSPSEDEGETPQLGRGMRHRKLRFRSPAEDHGRLSCLYLDKDEYKPSIKARKERQFSGPTERTCHQCRRSDTRLSPKTKCTNVKSNGQPCTLAYCSSCIMIRYDEPFKASATAWTCPYCRGICNCSLCIRNAGFGYIWDGSLAAEIKQGNVRYRRTPVGQDIVHPVPSIRSWFARQGVITGSLAWMSQRRKEGVRFIVGRSPSPGLDSSTSADGCRFIRQFEKDMDDEDENPVERDGAFDGASVQQTTPINSTDSHSDSNPSLPNPSDVFAPCRGGTARRFYVGQLLKHMKSPRMARPRTKAPDADMGRDAPKGDQPQAMKGLRRSVKKPGFYAEVLEDSSEEDEEGAGRRITAGVETETKTEVAVAQNGPSQSEPELVFSSEPTLSYSSYSGSISDPTPNSTPDALYPSASLGTLNPFGFRELHSSASTQAWSSSGLNAQGLAFENHFVGNADKTDISTDIANWSDVTVSPAVKPSSHSEVMGPPRISLNANLDDFTLPLPDIYTFAAPDPLASGVESWVAAGSSNKGEDEDADAVGETDTENTLSVGVDER